MPKDYDLIEVQKGDKRIRFQAPKGMDEKLLQQRIREIMQEEQMAMKQTGEVTPRPSLGRTASKLPVGAMTAGMRYGPPFAVGAMTKKPSLIAAAGAAGEVTATAFEDWLNDPGVINLSEYIKERGPELAKRAGITWALDYTGQRVVAPILAAGMKRLIRLLGTGLGKMLLPKEIPLDIQTAQRVLRTVPGQKPLSLTLDQIHHEEGNLINWLGATYRSSLVGRGIAKSRDLTNVKYVKSLFDAYFDNVARKTDARTFGDTLYGVINREIDYVQGIRKSLYDNVRAIIKNRGETVATDALNAFLEREGHRAEVQSIKASIQDLLPKKGASASITNALEIQRRLNDFERGTAEYAVAQHIKQQIVPDIARTMRKIPGASEAYALAQKYFGATEDRLYNAVAESVRNTLKNYPSTVVGMLSSGSRRYDRLLALRDLFTKGRMAGVREAVGEAATQVSRADYERSVLMPLRYAILNEAIEEQTKRLSGTKLGQVLDRLNAKEVPFTKEVFGPAAEFIRDIATTMHVIERTTAGDKVFIQLIQGGMLITAASALVARRADDAARPFVRRLGPGAIAVFTAPIVLAKGMGNPKFVRALQDGIKGGPKSEAFARMMIALTTQSAAANAYLHSLKSADAVQFFTDFANKLQLEPEEEEGFPTEANVPPTESFQMP